MPLSEHEQRLLDQIERALYTEDPKFAHTVRTTDPRTHYRRRIIQAAIGFVAGVGLLLAGVISKIIPVGVIGFLVMLACCVWGLSSWKRANGAGGEKAPPRTARQRRPTRSPGSARTSFMQRIEERWQHRRDGGP
ncbi:MAG: DUF3040 domain-containing protein [Streptosporangiaceae bacterium]